MVIGQPVPAANADCAAAAGSSCGSASPDALIPIADHGHLLRRNMQSG